MTKRGKYVTIYRPMDLSVMALMEMESSKLEISRDVMAHEQQLASGKAVNQTNMLIYLEVRNLCVCLVTGHKVQQSKRH